MMLQFLIISFNKCMFSNILMCIFLIYCGEHAGTVSITVHMLAKNYVND